MWLAETLLVLVTAGVLLTVGVPVEVCAEDGVGVSDVVDDVVDTAVRVLDTALEGVVVDVVDPAEVPVGDDV